MLILNDMCARKVLPYSLCFFLKKTTKDYNKLQSSLVTEKLSNNSLE